jgi:hypothetical protein
MYSASLSRQWTLACQDAELTPNTDVKLYVLGGKPQKNAELAIHLHPGSRAVSEPRFPLSQAQVADANRPEIVGLHRIAAFVEYPPAVLLGLLRHELQHARQWRFDQTAYTAGEPVADMLSRVRAYTGAGASSVYNLLPLERDANFAAFSLVRQHFGAVSQVELVNEHGQLLDFDRSWALTESLSSHTIEAAALHPNEFEEACRESRDDLASTLRALHPNGPAVWQQLRSDDELSERRAAFPSAVPSATEIAAAGDRPAVAWRRLHDALLDAMAFARAIIQKMQ